MEPSVKREKKINLVMRKVFINETPNQEKEKIEYLTA